MDFFERQDKARRNTRLLVFYFAIAVLCLIAAVDAAVALIFGGVSVRDSTGEMPEIATLFNLLSVATVGTLAVVSIGSVTKTFQLSSGGSAVAELLDGRLISSNTTDADERKLLNVVEEMSIASGVPVPQVYVLENENGINAFAAGHSTSDAAIGVTRGAIELLSRDELQGVIAHEFSHVLNGDMRLNIRLMGLIFGIVCLTVIGRVLVRTRGRKNPLPLLGLALIVIGWAGVFFGRLIQAAVSRQRECLADASAVQFTRNPGGLANALKKIGALEQGSTLNSPHAEEASHLFFANGLSESFLQLFETHPPLIERIRELDPTFDGKFSTEILRVQSEPPPLPDEVRRPKPIPFAPHAVAQQAIVASVGQPTATHVEYAVDLKQAIPSSLEATTREPINASALIYALLLVEDPAAREKQLDELARITSEPVRQETMRIWPDSRELPAQLKIASIDLALPALRRLSRPQFESFRLALEALIGNETDLFEFMLQKIVVRHLETHFYPARRPAIQFYDLRGLTQECGVLLSATAYAGQHDATKAYAAFQQGAQSLSAAARSEIPWVPPDQCELAHVDASLGRLSQAVPQIKKNVLNACVLTVSADKLVQEREAELLRAIADALDCPIPPFV